MELPHMKIQYLKWKFHWMELIEVDIAEEKISELEDIVRETMQTEAQEKEKD